MKIFRFAFFLLTTSSACLPVSLTANALSTAPVVNPKEMSSCPYGTVTKASIKHGSREVRCVPAGDGSTSRILRFDGAGNVTEIRETGSSRGPAIKAYTRYYQSLPPKTRAGMIAPNEPYLVVAILFQKGKVGELLAGIGTGDPGDINGGTIAVFDPVTGAELVREVRRARQGNKCKQYEFSSGLTSQHCSGDAVGDEYAESGYLRTPSFSESSCADNAGNTIKLKIVHSKEGTEIWGYKNGQLVETRKSADGSKIYSEYLSTNDRTGIPKSASSIWTALAACEEIDGRPMTEVGARAQHSMAAYFQSEMTRAKIVDEAQAPVPRTSNTQTVPATDPDAARSKQKAN